MLELLTEARDLAAELGDVDLQTEAMLWRVPALLVVFDLEAARQEVAAVHATAERTAQPFNLHVAEHCGSAIALCEGRLDEADALAQRSHEWSRLLTGRDASGVYGIQMFGVRREQGRLSELAAMTRLLARPGRSLAPRAGGTAGGARDAGRARPSWRGSRSLDAFRESLWLASLTYLTDACAAVGDEASPRSCTPSWPRWRRERRDRPRRRLLRRGRPLPGHARHRAG